MSLLVSRNQYHIAMIVEGNMVIWDGRIDKPTPLLNNYFDWVHFYAPDVQKLTVSLPWRDDDDEDIPRHRTA